LRQWVIFPLSHFVAYDIAHSSLLTSCWIDQYVVAGKGSLPLEQPERNKSIEECYDNLNIHSYVSFNSMSPTEDAEVRSSKPDTRRRCQSWSPGF
jgi:hypothetical protein